MDEQPGIQSEGEVVSDAIVKRGGGRCESEIKKLVLRAGSVK